MTPGSTSWIWFQRTYAYSHGMDSMEPEFEQIWMGLWRFQMMLWPTMALIQVITRFSNLLDVQWNKQSRVILDNVI